MMRIDNSSPLILETGKYILVFHSRLVDLENQSSRIYSVIALF